MTSLVSIGKQANGDQMVSFRCPGCDDYHQIRVGTWTFNGDVKRPTFSPSVLVRYDVSPPNQHLSIVCHSFVTDGRIQFLGDCTHSLAGQTVDLPPWTGFDE